MPAGTLNPDVDGLAHFFELEWGLEIQWVSIYLPETLLRVE
jgi:hypothetical protein